MTDAHVFPQDYSGYNPPSLDSSAVLEAEAEAEAARADLSRAEREAAALQTRVELGDEARGAMETELGELRGKVETLTRERDEHRVE